MIIVMNFRSCCQKLGCLCSVASFWWHPLIPRAWYETILAAKSCCWKLCAITYCRSRELPWRQRELKKGDRMEWDRISSLWVCETCHVMYIDSINRACLMLRSLCILLLSYFSGGKRRKTCTGIFRTNSIVSYLFNHYVNSICFQVEEACLPFTANVNATIPGTRSNLSN